MNKKNLNNVKNNNLMRLSYSKNNNLIIEFFYILRKIFGGDRFSNLIPYLENEIFNIKKKINRKLYLLDYGCGKMDFSIFLIKKRLINKAICVDNYDLKKNIINKKTQYINISQNQNVLKKKNLTSQ